MRAYLELHMLMMEGYKMALVGHMQVWEDCMMVSLEVVHIQLERQELETHVQQPLQVARIGFGRDGYLHLRDDGYYREF